MMQIIFKNGIKVSITKATAEAINDSIINGATSFKGITHMDNELFLIVNISEVVCIVDTNVLEVSCKYPALY